MPFNQITPPIFFFFAILVAPFFGQPVFRMATSVEIRSLNHQMIPNLCCPSLSVVRLNLLIYAAILTDE
jgi:hypothetical protein